MELWIRSQNKTELMKVIDLDIYDAGEPKTYVIESRGIILGNYKTQKRALEVLDEIHEHIEKQGRSEIIANENGRATGVKYYGKIYEMPEE